MPQNITPLGYAQKSSPAMMPRNIPTFEALWRTNVPHPKELVHWPASQYFSSIGLAIDQKNMDELVDGSLISRELRQEDSDYCVWHEWDVDSVKTDDQIGRSSRAEPSGDGQQFTTGGSNAAYSSQQDRFEDFGQGDHGVTLKKKGSSGENYGVNSRDQRTRENDLYSTNNSRLVSTSESTSSRAKPSSANYWDRSPLKTSKVMRDKWGNDLVPSSDPSVLSNLQPGAESVDYDTSQVDDQTTEAIPLSTVGYDVVEMAVSETRTSHFQTHSKSVYKSDLGLGSELIPSVPPALVDSELECSGHDNRRVLPYALNPSGPPFPSLTMFPVYNRPTETETYSASKTHSDEDEPFNIYRKGQSDCSDSTKNLHLPGNFNISTSTKDDAPMQRFENRKPDILNNDFFSHWKNLQYGRFCQNSLHYGSLLYPSSVVTPPVYLQGQFPYECPGKLPSENMNIFPQFMSYNSHLLPKSQLHIYPDGPDGANQQYADKSTSYSGGSGLPNPKTFSCNIPCSNTRGRRRSYNYDKKDHHCDREGNWNIDSKPRSAGRAQGHKKVEKPTMRFDKSTANHSRSNMPPWDLYKHHPFPSSYHRSSSNFSEFTNHSLTNIAYGVYPVPIAYANVLSPSGAASPSVVMMCPYDQDIGYVSSAECFEFGSLQPVHFSGVDKTFPVHDQ